MPTDGTGHYFPNDGMQPRLAPLSVPQLKFSFPPLPNKAQNKEGSEKIKHSNWGGRGPQEVPYHTYCSQSILKNSEDEDLTASLGGYLC